MSMGKSIFVVYLVFRAVSECLGDRDSLAIVEKAKECRGEYSGYRYIVSSPNYPEAYSEKGECLYTLRGSPLAKCDQTFNLDFLDFSLSPSKNCAESYVEIDERSFFCGRLAGTRTYSSKDNRLVLRFRSGEAGSGRFKILVTASPCTPGQILVKDRASTSVVNEQLDGTKANESPNNHLVETLVDESKRSTKVQIVTPSTRISSYLFVPPAHETRPASSLISISPTAHSFGFGPPSTQFFPPTRESVVFREKEELVREDSSFNNRSGELVRVPASSYGLPGQPCYQPKIPCASNDPVPDLEVTANFRQTNPALTEYSGSEGQLDKIPCSPMTYGFPNEGVSGDRCPGGTRGAGERDDCSIGVNSLPPRSSDYYPQLFSNGNYIDKLCCNRYFAGLRFLLASPGFPSLGYNGQPYECVYSIIPYSLDICRMRFNFKFFNHGTPDYSCSNGYVEIDGRRICGCRKGLSVSSIVTSAFPKTIALRYTGYPRSKFNGFLIEVVQESCSNRFPYLSRARKDVGNGTNADGPPAARTKRDTGYSYPKPSFGLTETPGFASSGNRETSGGGVAVDSLLSPLFACQTLSFLDWTIAAKEAYLQNARCPRPNPFTPDYPGYRPNDWNNGAAAVPGYSGQGGILGTVDGKNVASAADCEDVNVSEGIVSSPGYPIAYPGNLAKCFRFYKAPDTCQLELVILDFDLENSAGCAKDYVTFGGRNGRYCGRSLSGIKTLFDTSRSETFIIRFVTDGFGSGRGFSAGFSQIPCRRSTNGP